MRQRTWELWKSSGISTVRSSLEEELKDLVQDTKPLGLSLPLCQWDILLSSSYGWW